MMTARFNQITCNILGEVERILTLISSAFPRVKLTIAGHPFVVRSGEARPLGLRSTVPVSAASVAFAAVAASSAA